MHWFDALGLIALGLFAGCYGTMAGLGGGFLIVPVLLLMHFDSRIAAGTSMAVVLANSVSGTVSYVRQKRVDVATGVVFAAAGIPGALLGATVDQAIPQRLFGALFAGLLLWVGIRMLTTDVTQHVEIADESQRDDEPRPGLRRTIPGYVSRDFHDAGGKRFTYRYNVASAAVTALGAGFVASLFGIGGGIVQVPAMVYFYRIPAPVATATSMFVIAITALFATGSHAFYGDVRWAEALLISAGAVVGAQIGARLAQRVAPAPLMRLLAIAALVTAVKFLWSALG